MLYSQPHYVRVASQQDVPENGHLVVNVEGHTIALFHHQEQIYALDNRCPHMGFPLHRGSVSDCLLTCHWHHARFDLSSGGTFDPWADDVRTFGVQLRDGQVWVNIAPPSNDALTNAQQRLSEGLEQNIALVIAKSVLALLTPHQEPNIPFQIGLDFGVRYRKEGWGAGLTIHTCMINIFPYLDQEDQPRALYHGLAAVASECALKPPRFPLPALPDAASSVGQLPLLTKWFRQFIEVRDAQGAERCLISALEMGADSQQIAQILFAAVTDHRYLDGGHALDFTNKALEALDATNWHNSSSVLSSLVKGYAQAQRKEESNSWRYPIDLVALLEDSFAKLEEASMQGKEQRGSWGGREQLVTILLGEDPQAIVDSLLAALRAGATEEELAGSVAYAAALRIAQFHTNNDFRDWDSAHHSFTFAHAVHQGLRRVASPLLLRGVFDGAMSVYLNRFLNIPPARLPKPDSPMSEPEILLPQLSALLNQQQQVNEVGKLVANYLYSGGNPERLLAMLGKLLVREDRDFHTIQAVEAAFCQYAQLRETKDGIYVLVAAARYLAAHAPTRRSQEQTYQMAEKLHRGERVFEAS